MRSLLSLWVVMVISSSAALAESAYWVEFDGAPAVTVQAASLKQSDDNAATLTKTREQIAANAAQQARALDAMKSRGHAVKELFRVQRVLNAVGVLASDSEVAALRALHGVKSVTPLARVHLLNSTSVPFVHAPELWEALPEGVTGRGVRIGVIDTGVDYLHPDFGGSGDHAAYAANDPLVTGDVPFPTAKVVGGLDFVGDAYDPVGADHNVPIPDPDPMDQHGHGTHVAGTAAGAGVAASGQTYAGPYDADIAFTTMQIGPGVAPEASIFALKVFGKSGDTEVLVPAIEWSVDPDGDGDFSDHLDVINMSLGEEFGRAESPFSVAASNAAAAGVVVVVAAGNDGDTYGLVVSPGSAPAAISVAASEHLNPASSNLVPDRLAGFSSRGPGILSSDRIVPKPDLAAPGVGIVSAALGSPSSVSLRQTLSGTSMACPHVAGAAALVRQLHPDWRPHQVKALLMNTGAPTLFVYRSGGSGTWPVPPSRGGAGRLDGSTIAATSVIAFALEIGDGVTLSFGAIDVPAPAPITVTRQITLENHGESEAVVTPSLAPLEAVPGATLSLDSANVAVPAHGSSTVELRLTLDPTKLEQPRERTAAVNYNVYYRHFLTEVMGFVKFSIQGGGTLTLPYYGCVRPVGDLEPATALLHESTLPGSLSFTGTPVFVLGAHGVQSMVSPFELLYVSPILQSDAPGESIADLRMIGTSLSVDAQGNLPADPVLTFGISVAAPWMTLHSVRFYVFIDVDLDGAVDYTLRNGLTRGNQGGSKYSDAFTSELYDSNGILKAVQLANGVPPDGTKGMNTALLRSDVLALPLRLADLHLTASQRTIQFVVESVIDPNTSLSGLRFVDAVPEQGFESGISRWLRVSVAEAGLAFPKADGTAAQPNIRAASGGAGLYFNPETYAEEGTFDAAGRREFGPLGILFLQHHNAAGARAQAVPLLTIGDSDGDGLPDEVEGAGDVDGDGFPNFADADSDGDGIPDADEGTGDPDADGVPNYLDTDSDNDTLPDAEEFGTGASDPYSADTDGDGLGDALEGSGDPDGDFVPNARDDDSDGDGIPDAVEGVADPDSDDVPAFLDLDSDNDGVADREDGTTDVDGDQLPNFLDADSDNDGLLDGDEAARGTDQNLVDTDGDLVNDGAEASAGRDPLVPDVPVKVESVVAASVDCVVQVGWAPALGAAEYRVMRALVPKGGAPDVSQAEPVSEWSTAIFFTDDTGQFSHPESRHGCHVEQPRTFEYAYFVNARNLAGAGPASDPARTTRICNTP